jgi:4-hydroxy-3-methylbut-2-enyl diphosphate reductase
MDSLERPRLTILLAGPRGFCAGVERAIEIVERALEKYGRPVYVRHDIVHNKTVVEELEAKGAVFVEELSEVPEDVPVVFSAHGVPKSVPKEAAARKLFYLDATCPLVTKVHVDAERHFAAGRQIILIGHEGHPEVVGTMGQLPEGAILLVQDTKHAETVAVDDPTNLAYVTQTTLSVDDCRDIVAVLTRRFPQIEGPRKEDICYATTNRQAAVKEVAQRCDALIVLGAPNSSNSNRLREVAVAAGCPKAIMIQRAGELDFGWLKGVKTLGITAGASAPEKLVQEVIQKCREHYDLDIEQVEVTRENVRFSLPRVLTA